MKLSVVGVGYVGLVTATCLAEAGNNVICVDNNAEKIKGLKNAQIPIYETGLTELVKKNLTSERLNFTTDLKLGIDNSLIIFIAVGTPSAPDGSADTSAIIQVTSQIAENLKDYRIIATKSTVPVGTYKIVSETIKAKTKIPFDYVSNPEFLKEGAAVQDFLSPERIIIGTEKPEVQQTFKQLYQPFMRRKNRIVFMDHASAEMTKYAANAMLATRISFMNELAALCEKTGADIELVRDGIASDSRIGSAFLFPGVGFGGSCFPKDIRELIHTGEKFDSQMNITKAVQNANLNAHNSFVQKIKKQFHQKENQTTLAVWGLAFKAKTDDIRESPAIYCVEKFLQAGFKIQAYDPEANQTALEKLKNKIKICQNEYEALKNADALVILTDWQEFRNPDFKKIKNSLNTPLIFDGRNLYETQILENAGFQYLSVGRKTILLDN